MKIDLKTKSTSPTAAFIDMMGGGKPAGGVTQLPVDSLRPYPDQPFQAYTPDRLEQLATDIRENGVLSPVIVRPSPDGTEGYQILAGHNRTAAARLAGLPTVPCIIREVSDDEAKLILVNTNLLQRESILPSEKAFAYKMQLEALNHQGKRVELSTSRTFCAKSETDPNGESRRSIQYYIRLTYLIRPLLDWVDTGAMPFRAGVNISYLTESQQRTLHEYCEENEIRINLRYSEHIKDMVDSGEFTREALDRLFTGKEARPPKSLKLPMKTLRPYFGGMDETEITRKVLEIIRQHFAIG